MDRMELALRLEAGQFEGGQVLKKSGDSMEEVVFLVHGRAEVVASLR